MNLVNGVGQGSLAGNVGVAAAGPLDVVGVDVVGAGHPRVVRQHHSAVVVRQDVLDR